MKEIYEKIKGNFYFEHSEEEKEIGLYLKEQPSILVAVVSGGAVLLTTALNIFQYNEVLAKLNFWGVADTNIIVENKFNLYCVGIALAFSILCAIAPYILEPLYAEIFGNLFSDIFIGKCLSKFQELQSNILLEYNLIVQDCPDAVDDKIEQKNTKLRIKIESARRLSRNRALVDIVKAILLLCIIEFFYYLLFRLVKSFLSLDSDIFITIIIMGITILWTFFIPAIKPFFQKRRLCNSYAEAFAKLCEKDNEKIDDILEISGDITNTNMSILSDFRIKRVFGQIVSTVICFVLMSAMTEGSIPDKMTTCNINNVDYAVVYSSNTQYVLEKCTVCGGDKIFVDTGTQMIIDKNGVEVQTLPYDVVWRY